MERETELQRGQVTSKATRQTLGFIPEAFAGLEHQSQAEGNDCDKLSTPGT